MQEYKIVKQVLLDYVDEEVIFYDEEENCFSCHIGILGELNGSWSLSFDLNILKSSREMLIACNIIIDLMNHQIMCQIDSPFYSVFNSEGVCVDLLWDSDICEVILETKESYEVAKERLTKEILNKEFSPENTTNISNAH